MYFPEGCSRHAACGCIVLLAGFHDFRELYKKTSRRLSLAMFMVEAQGRSLPLAAKIPFYVCSIYI